MKIEIKDRDNKVIITTVIAALIVIFVTPWLSFWCSYFVGWLSKIIIGKYLVAGFALVNIDMPLDKIPLFAGCLGWVASFFMQHKQNS